MIDGGCAEGSSSAENEGECDGRAGFGVQQMVVIVD